MKDLQIEDSAQVHAAFLVYMDLTEGEFGRVLKHGSQFEIPCVAYPGLLTSPSSNSFLTGRKTWCHNLGSHSHWASCSLQCGAGRRCPAWRVLSCRWFCWKRGRRKEHPLWRSSPCPLTSLWLTKGVKTLVKLPHFYPHRLPCQTSESYSFFLLCCTAYDTSWTGAFLCCCVQ